MPFLVDKLCVSVYVYVHVYVHVYKKNDNSFLTQATAYCSKVQYFEDLILNKPCGFLLSFLATGIHFLLCFIAYSQKIIKYKY